MKCLSFNKAVFTVILGVGITFNAYTQEIYFPPQEGDWQTVTPADSGWNADNLAEVLAYAGEQRSSGVVILLDGHILAEGYWEVRSPETGNAGGYPNLIVGRTETGQTIEDVASLQKSITSVLAGIARGKGMLNFDKPEHPHTA